MSCVQREDSMAARRLLRRYLAISEQLLYTGRSCWTDAPLQDAGRWSGCRKLSSLAERFAPGSDPVEDGHNVSQECEQEAPLVTNSRHFVAWEVPGLLSLSGLEKAGGSWSSSSGFPASVRHSRILLRHLAVCQQLPYSNAALRDGMQQEQNMPMEGSTTTPPAKSQSHVKSGPDSEIELGQSEATGVDVHASESNNNASVAYGWSKKDVLNWPNSISMARLISGPVLGWLIVEGITMPALLGLVLAGASDWLDGYVARKSGLNTVLGSYLDPLADKVLIGSIALSMALAGLLHPALVTFVLARDVALIISGFVLRAVSLRWTWSGWGEFFNISPGGAELVRPLFISKVNTVLQLALVATALLQPAFGVEDTYYAVPILSWSVVATTSLSWYAYGKQYLRRSATKS